MSKVVEHLRALFGLHSADETLVTLGTDFRHGGTPIEPYVRARDHDPEQRWQVFLPQIKECFEGWDVAWDQMGPFVLAASKRPELRRLYPHSSLHGYCMFARCSGHQSDCYLASVAVKSRRSCIYEGTVSVPGSEEEILLGAGDADHAADLVVRHLPEDCHPFKGTVVELARQLSSREGVPVARVLERLCPLPPGLDHLRPQVSDDDR